MRLVACGGYLAMICLIGLNLDGFGFGISGGVIWDLLIWFGLVSQWLLVDLVVVGVLV